MDKIVDVFNNLPGGGGLKNDDDIFDRVNHRYTVALLIVFTIVVSVQYWGTTINCWAPVHFTGSHTKFATSYCWVKNTYYLPYEDEIPKTWEHDKRQVIPYYQWIPFILLAQAVLFYAPNLFWHAFNSKGGIDADDVMETATAFNDAEKMENKDKTLGLLVRQMDRFLTQKKNRAKRQMIDFSHLLSSTICRPCGTTMGNYLVVLYMFVKVAYIFNAFFQFYLMNHLLGTKYALLGLEIIKGMVLSDHNWVDNPFVAFPRVTMCDFNIRRLGNVHRYTLQCVLPINLYNEKIYIFLWFWMLLVAILNIVAFLVWLLRFCMGRDKVLFIRNHLRTHPDPDVREEADDKDALQNFVFGYLKQDGAFILRLIAHNTSNLTVNECVYALWKYWKENHDEGRPYGRQPPDDTTLPLKPKGGQD